MQALQFLRHVTETIEHSGTEFIRISCNVSHGQLWAELLTVRARNHLIIQHQQAKSGIGSQYLLSPGHRLSPAASSQAPDRLTAAGRRLY